MSYLSTNSPQTVTGLSGLTVNISGSQTVSYATSLKTNTWTTIATLSGGTNLAQRTCRAVTVQNLPTNVGNMHVGGSNPEGPNVSRGFVLTPGAALTLYVQDFNEVWVYATVSGEKVATIGEVR